MNWLLGFYRSTVGKKVIMGVTGIVWVGYVVLHMLGNLQVFLGPEKINGYARLLHGPAAELLWLIRLVLLGAFVLHVAMAFQLTAAARRARPVRYERRVPQISTWGARTMLLGGLALLLFVPLHVAHFTTGWWRPAGYFEDQRPYENLVFSFRVWWVALLYIVMMVAIGLHLYHGAWSSLRTLGLKRATGRPFERRVATALAVVVWLGFTLVPVAIWAGLVPLPHETTAAAPAAAPAAAAVAPQVD